MEWAAGAVVAWSITSVKFHHSVAIVCWLEGQIQVERINLKYYLLQSRSRSCLLNVEETWRDLKTITQTRSEPESNPEAGDRCSPGGCVLVFLHTEYQNIHSISKMRTFLRSEVKPWI